MKRYISKFLKSVAAFLLAFPLSHIVICAILFDIPVNLCVRILLSPIYYLVGAVTMISGYGLWEMRRWAWYPFILANVLISYENAIFLNEYGESHHKVLAFIASLLLQAFLILRVSREIRVPYFFPKI